MPFFTPDEVNAFFNEHGILNQRYGDLAIFNYGRMVQYEKTWTERSLQCRGLIINVRTRELVARPFRKFFNLNETPEASLENLPKVPFCATEKLDGVYGIHYVYEGQHRIATRGSFESKWALWATDWLNSQNHLRLEEMDMRYTYLFEIIAPISRIVVDYQGKEALVLIGMVDKETGKELPYNALVEHAHRVNLEVVKAIPFTSIKEAIVQSTNITNNEEGWVFTFENGLKVKIKGDEYRKIYKFLTHTTPLAFWELWDYSASLNREYDKVGISKEALARFPEEFREDTDSLAKAIDKSHWDLFHSCLEEAKKMAEMMNKLDPNDDGRLFSLKLKERKDLPKEIKGIVSFIYFGNYYKAWRRIHLKVKPKDNDLQGYDYSGILKRHQEFGRF